MESLRCHECRSANLVQMAGDITCRNCGLEQGFGNMVDDYDSYMRVGSSDGLMTLIGGSSFSSLNRMAAMVNSANNEKSESHNDKDMLDNIQV